MSEFTSNPFEQIIEAFQLNGWVGALSALSSVGVELLQLSPVQRLLPVPLKWESLNFWGRVAFAFVVIFAANFGGAVLGGVALLAALKQAAAVTIGSVVLKKMIGLGVKKS